MKNGLLLVVIAALSYLVYALEPKVDYNFLDSSLPVEKRVEILLSCNQN